MPQPLDMSETQHLGRSISHWDWVTYATLPVRVIIVTVFLVSMIKANNLPPESAEEHGRWWHAIK